jgi:hypothetical protein
MNPFDYALRLIPSFSNMNQPIDPKLRKFVGADQLLRSQVSFTEV